MRAALFGGRRHALGIADATKSAEESHDPEALVAAQMRLVKQIQRLCNSTECRHKALSEYFGQSYEQPNCGACDVCLAKSKGWKTAP